MLPQTGEILASIAGALPEKDRLQETLAKAIGEAVQNSLPERVWLESLSRGLFDDRTKGVLPRREEVAGMIREEIHGKLLSAIEKIIREEIEKIASDLAV
jgi:hypothetical protein